MTGKAWLACVLWVLALGPSLVGQVQAPVGVEVNVGPVAVPEVVRGRGRSIPIGTSVITGVVTDARTRLPVAGARVGVSGPADPVATRASSSPEPQPTRTLSRAATTDDSGRFRFDALPAGEFIVTANRMGFLPTTYGAAKPDRPGTPIRIDRGQRVDVSMSLLRGGVVSGVITSPDGLPEVQAQVRALRLTTGTGVRHFQPMGSTMTDDRGAYRIFNLSPGAYVIAVKPESGELTSAERLASDNARFEDALARARQGSGALPSTLVVPMAPPQVRGWEPAGYANVYYPGTAQLAHAVVMTVEADAERLGVDFVATPVRAAHIIGTVVGIPPGLTRVTTSQEGGYINTESTRIQVAVYGDGEARDLGQVSGTSADSSGRFVFSSLAPGRYHVLAHTVTSLQMRVTAESRGAGPGGPSEPLPPRSPPPPVLWGRAIVEVGGQPTPDVTIVLQPGRTISGQVVYDGVALAGLSRPPVQVTAIAAPDAPQGSIPRTPQATAEPDGRFTLTDVIPGRYMLRASGPVKSAIVNGADSLDFPFQVEEVRDIVNAVVTMSGELGELSGTVMQSSGTPATDYTVVIAPSDSRYWLPGARRVQLARPTSAGRFVFRGMPAGDYLVAAVTDIEPGGHYDPAFLKAMIAAAVRVSIADGGRHVQDIRVAAGVR